VALVAGLTVGAGSAFAAASPPAPRGPATGVDACAALVAGTVADTGRGDAVSKAMHSCAVECGTLVDQVRAGRKPKLNPAASPWPYECAAACDFITLEAASPRGKANPVEKGPIATAAYACAVLAAANPKGTAGLPLIDSGGRSWR
jgi:hypothetical protein